MFSLASASEAILAAAWPGVGLSILTACVLSAGLGAVIAVGIVRSRTPSARRICDHRSQLSSGLQSNLRQLQWEDTATQLGAAWNQLIEEVVAARRDLDEIHIRQQARDTLNQSETKWLTQLLGQIPYGLVTVAEDWVITFANAAAERLLGSPEGGLKGRHLTEFVAKDLSNIKPRSGIVIDHVTELNASPTLVRLTATNAEGAAEGGKISLMLQDVTQERDRSHLLHHITHELRTPLTNIRAYAENLSEGVPKDPETLRECYNVIVGETQRLDRLVEDLLSLSQMDG